MLTSVLVQAGLEGFSMLPPLRQRRGLGLVSRLSLFRAFAGFPLAGVRAFCWPSLHAKAFVCTTESTRGPG